MNIEDVSNPSTVKYKLDKILPGSQLYLSTRKNKKYMIQKPDNTWVHFGDSRYADHTKHRDDSRRINYLKRATKIKGNWKNDPYSPNSLSINLLWG